MTRERLLTAGLLLSLTLNAVALVGVFGARDAAPTTDPDVLARLYALERRAESREVDTARHAPRPATTSSSATAPKAPTSGSPTTARATTTPAAGSSPAAVSAMRAAIEREVSANVGERLERELDDRMARMTARQRHRNARGEWEPPIDDLSAELGLTEDQATQARAIFDGARDQTFDLLSTERSDGGSLLDDFAEDLIANPDHGQVTRDFFGKLAKVDVPGTDRTYLEHLIEVRQRTLDDLNGQLDERQRATLGDLKIDPLAIKTGHDPVLTYIGERMGR